MRLWPLLLVGPIFLMQEIWSLFLSLGAYSHALFAVAVPVDPGIQQVRRPVGVLQIDVNTAGSLRQRRGNDRPGIMDVNFEIIFWEG